MTDIACVLDARALLGEAPLWDAAEGALYWVDIKGHAIHRFDPASGADRAWPTAGDVGSLALRESGGLVIATAAGFRFFDPESGREQAIVDPEAERPGNRFNDGKPDREGRFWAGSMDDAEAAPTGALYRLDPDLSCHRMVEGIVCSNALCWSPDGRRLYFADSIRRTVWCWDFEPESGAIANRRVFLELEPGDGDPDGATVDAEGHLWLAHWGGWRVTRYDPDGRAERTVTLPVAQPTYPAFGGPELDRLYVTSARIGIEAAGLARQPLAGGLFAFDPGVKGIAERRFRG